MRYIEPNKSRGIWSLIAIFLIAFGAGFQWGFGAAMFAIGVDLSISCIIDNAVERFTNTTNWEQEE